MRDSRCASWTGSITDMRLHCSTGTIIKTILNQSYIQLLIKIYQSDKIICSDNICSSYMTVIEEIWSQLDRWSNKNINYKLSSNGINNNINEPIYAILTSDRRKIDFVRSYLKPVVIGQSVSLNIDLSTEEGVIGCDLRPLNCISNLLKDTAAPYSIGATGNNSSGHTSTNSSCVRSVAIEGSSSILVTTGRCGGQNGGSSVISLVDMSQSSSSSSSNELEEVQRWSRVVSDEKDLWLDTQAWPTATSMKRSEPLLSSCYGKFVYTGGGFPYMIARTSNSLSILV